MNCMGEAFIKSLLFKRLSTIVFRSEYVCSGANDNFCLLYPVTILARSSAALFILASKVRSVVLNVAFEMN